MSDQHTTVQYQLRLPEELRDKIKESAKNHNRSMNADIVARLEDSFDTSGRDGLVSTLDENLAHMTKQNDILLQEIKLMRSQIMSNNKVT